MKKTLIVASTPHAMVQDYEAMDRGINRFIGRRFSAKAGTWLQILEPVSVPDCAEYRLAIAAGDLVLLSGD